MREKDLDVKIPAGLELGAGELTPRIRASTKAYQKLFRDKCAQEIEDIEAEIKEIEQRLKVKVTKTWQSKLESKGRARDKLIKKAEDAVKEFDGESYRIYPFYYAPAVVAEGKERWLRPMRYRVLPANGVEIPTKYNLFNARRDSLFTAKTWKESFGKQHAIFPFMKFYEWVEGKGRPQEIVFSPDGFEDMWAASLYSKFKGRHGLIESIAMITDEPPPEVRAAGHDRCPVFLEQSLIDTWLSPKGKSLESLDGILSHKEPTHYSNKAVG